MRRLLVLLLLATLVSACGGRSPAPTYYHLVPDRPEPVEIQTQPATHLLGVREVMLPGVLKRPQLVAIEGEIVTTSERRRWSEPLDKAMLRYLAAGLTGSSPGWTAIAYPWPGQLKPERTVSIKVSRFSGAPGGSLELSGVWVLSAQAGQQPTLQRFVIRKPVAGDDYASLVRAHAAALDELVARIAAHLAD